MEVALGLLVGIVKLSILIPIFGSGALVGATALGSVFLSATMGIGKG